MLFFNCVTPNLMKKESGDPKNFLYGTSLFNRHNGKLFFRSSLSEDLGYSLQADRKTGGEREQHPDRNAQSEYIAEKTEFFRKENRAVLSADTEKKENIGNYKNNGREYSEKGKPVGVNMHDFTDKNPGKAAPYGVYDIGMNKGWVSVVLRQGCSILRLTS